MPTGPRWSKLVISTIKKKKNYNLIGLEKKIYSCATATVDQNFKHNYKITISLLVYCIISLFFACQCTNYKDLVPYHMKKKKKKKKSRNVSKMSNFVRNSQGDFIGLEEKKSYNIV
jgi:hypothetical protein